MKRLTIKAINKAVQAIDPAFFVQPGDGYFYWCSDTDVSYLEMDTVATFRINHMTLAQWIENFTTQYNRTDRNVDVAFMCTL